MWNSHIITWTFAFNLWLFNDKFHQSFLTSVSNIISKNSNMPVCLEKPQLVSSVQETCFVYLPLGVTSVVNGVKLIQSHYWKKEYPLKNYKLIQAKLCKYATGVYSLNTNTDVKRSAHTRLWFQVKATDISSALWQTLCCLCNLAGHLNLLLVTPWCIFIKNQPEKTGSPVTLCVFRFFYVKFVQCLYGCNIDWYKL